jgi:hypothetical protein
MASPGLDLQTPSTPEPPAPRPAPAGGAPTPPPAGRAPAGRPAGSRRAPLQWGAPPLWARPWTVVATSAARAPAPPQPPRPAPPGGPTAAPWWPPCFRGPAPRVLLPSLQRLSPFPSDARFPHLPPYLKHAANPPPQHTPAGSAAARPRAAPRAPAPSLAAAPLPSTPRPLQMRPHPVRARPGRVRRAQGSAPPPGRNPLRPGARPARSLSQALAVPTPTKSTEPAPPRRAAPRRAAPRRAPGGGRRAHPSSQAPAPFDASRRPRPCLILPRPQRIGPYLHPHQSTCSGAPRPGPAAARGAQPPTVAPGRGAPCAGP